MSSDSGGVFLPFGIKENWVAPLKRMTAATKEFAATLTKATSVTKENEKETNKNTGATIKWNEALGKLASGGLKKLTQFNARNLYRTFRDMPVLSLAAGEGLQEGAKAAMKFDRSLVDLELSGTASAAQISQITKASISLAENSKYTRNEILMQATALQKLGRSSDDAFKDVTAATHFATLMDTSLAEGVDAQIRVSQLYYGNVSHLADAGNMLAYSVKHLRIPMDSFVKTVERIGPAAALSNTPLEDTAGLLKGMTEAGIDSEKAGIALSRVMSQAARVHLTFNDALEKIRVNYQKAKKDHGAMGGAAYLESETGLRQTALLAPIFEKNAAAFKLYTHGAKDVADFTAQASAQMEAIPAEQLARALNDVKESMTSLATPIVSVFGAMLRGFNKLPNPIKFITMGIGTLTGLVVAALPFLSSFATGFKILSPILKLMWAPFARLVATFGGFGSILGTLATKILLPIAALWGLYKIVQLLKIGWDALTLKFEKKGLDNMGAGQKARVEAMQRAGMMNSQGKLTDQGRWSPTTQADRGMPVGRNSSETHNGIVLQGDMHVHVGGDSVLGGGKNDFVRELQKQVRASGR